MELKAGPELDRAVAEAVGGNCGFYLFRPSTDLNAAFAAAERALKQDWQLTCRKPDEWWMIPGGFNQTPSIAPTPALAICTAILKSSEEAKNKVEKL